MDKWRRFRKLSGIEKLLLLEALALLPLSTFAMRLVGFRRLQDFLRKLAASEESAHGEPTGGARERAQRTAQMVAAASREGLCQGNCLEQSLVLWWLLRRQKLAAQLRIGVRRQAGSLEAHAWVEFGGAVLNDRGDVHEEFSPFPQDIAALPAEKP